MTLASTTSSIQVAGDGLTTTFNYDFPMGGSDAYAVLIFTSATGATSSVTASAFSVTGVNNASGGTFTYPLVGSPISTGTYLTLYRTVPLVQTATIEDQGNFAPVIVDGAMDYEMMACQQLQREIDTLNGLVDSFLTGSISSVTTGMIANQAVTYPKFQNVAARKLLGNPTSASTTVSEIGIDSTLTFSGTTLGVASGQTPGLFFITSSSPTATSTITFGSLAQTFTSLRLIGIGRSTSTGTSTASVQMRFNGDTGSNYAYQTQFTNAGTVGGSQATAQTTAFVGELSRTGDVANYGNTFEILIPGYTGAFAKTCITHWNTFNGAATTSIFDVTGVATWTGTAAITQIDLIVNPGNWATGSQISVYGHL